MSKTLKLNVSFPMTIVVSAESIKDIQEARKEAREVPAEKVAQMKGEAKFRFGLFVSDRTDEELLELIYRAGIREFIRKDLVSEITGNEATGYVGDTKVVFETPMQPKVVG